MLTRFRFAAAAALVAAVLLAPAISFKAHDNGARWLDAPKSLASILAPVQAQFTTGRFWVPASACVSSVSGNGTGTNGLTTVGASVTPVMQAQTSVTGSNTHTYVCNITPPFRTNGTNGIGITGATFYYGVQTTGLGTQAAVLASGTMNSVIVFGKIAMPTPQSGETPSTVTPVRADAGTLTITPVVGSFNVGTTTAGAFFSAKFTPATAFITADLTTYLLTVPLVNTGTSATITNVPGVMVQTQ